MKQRFIIVSCYKIGYFHVFFFCLGLRAWTIIRLLQKVKYKNYRKISMLHVYYFVIFSLLSYVYSSFDKPSFLIKLFVEEIREYSITLEFYFINLTLWNIWHFSKTIYYNMDFLHPVNVYKWNQFIIRWLDVESKIIYHRGWILWIYA